MAERYQDNFSLYSTVLRETKVFERWFRIASGNVAYFDASDETFLYDAREAGQYFALYWQQFDATVLGEEPGNGPFRRSLVESDDLVRSVFGCDGIPREFLEE